MTRPFDAVVAEHGATILRVCRAHLQWHDAEDAWSETFLAALRAYDTLPGDANVQAWLVTIAHRKCIDALRSRGRRAAPTSDESAIWSEAAEGHTPVGTALTARIDGVEDAANRIDLWAAIDTLPTKQRHAVVYHHIAGLSHAEVAEIVGGSAEAARRASADGVGALRRAYTAGEDAESRRTKPAMQPGGQP